MKQLLLLVLCAGLMSSCTLFQKSSGGNKTVKQRMATDAEIQALYDALDQGGIIKLKNLNYQLDRPLIIANKENLSLDGGGATLVMTNKDEDVVLVDNSTDIRLVNFKATHIEPNGPIGCTGSVIQVRYSTDVLIEKCELNGSGIIGVTSYENKNLKVYGNYIYNNSKYGVLFDEDTQIEVKNNIFEKNGQSGNDHVVKALNAYLSEVENIDAGTENGQIKMIDNKFK